MLSALGPEESGPLTTRHGDQIRKPTIPTRDSYLISETKVSEHNSMSKRDDAMVRSLWFPARPRTLLQSILQTAGTGRRGPGLVSISRNRSLRQALKNKVEKTTNYLMFTIQYTIDRGMAVTMAMLPPQPTKPTTLP